MLCLDKGRAPQQSSGEMAMHDTAAPAAGTEGGTQGVQAYLALKHLMSLDEGWEDLQQLGPAP